jgi:hypothetical protein
VVDGCCMSRGEGVRWFWCLVGFWLWLCMEWIMDEVVGDL